jgi:nucleotide-binding universal stress UspA family protein
MFKHILLPTDGSPLSDAAVAQCVQFARATGATITGFHAIPEFRVFTSRPEMLEDTKERFLEDSRAHAKEYLAVLESVAREAGVPCDTAVSVSDEPYREIIRIAEQKGCDLIAMASHGRKGIKGLLIGSETQKVLSHSQITVLVFR